MKNRAQKGSITVFLSLLLMLLISLITTSLESAHLAAVRGQIGMGSEAAMYTLFSYFEKSLYEKYKLLFLNDRQDFNKILENEIDLYGVTEEGIRKGSNHLRFGTNSVSVAHMVHLMDNGGAAFQEEINQILTSDMISLVKKSISGNIERLSQSGTITEYMNQIMEQGVELEALNEKISQAAEKSVLAGEKITDLEKNADSTLEIAKEYRAMLEKTDSEAESGYETAEEEKKLNKALKKLSDDKKTLENEFQSMLTVLDEYEKSAGKITSNLEDVSKGLLNEKLDESYKETLYDELKSIMDMTSESGDYYQQISAAKSKVEQNLKELQSVSIPSEGNITQDDILNKDVEKNLKQAGDKIRKCSMVDISVTETVVDSKYAFPGKSLLKTVQKLITEGVFSIIVDNQAKLSKRNVDMAEKPSQGKNNETGGSGKSMFQTAVDNTRDTLALNIYLTEYMDCYTDDGNYDLEYILGKSNSDGDNLKTAINQLVYLRQAMNLVYLLTDTVKKQQARTTAAAMLAVTGNAALIQGMTMIILTAWAYAEAVSDVKALIDGEQIDFIKNSGSWNLSLEQAADYRNWTGQSKSSEKTGMNYKEYLRILLFFHSRNSNMLRGLDMIQWNICQKDAKFRISQCVYSVEADFSLYVKPIFLSIKGMSLDNQSGYTYEHKEQKKYG